MIKARHGDVFYVTPSLGPTAGAEPDSRGRFSCEWVDDTLQGFFPTTESLTN